MKRRWFLVLGILMVISNVAVLAAFGFPLLSESITVAGTVLTILAAILFTFGGLDRQFQNFEWYQFVGGANVIAGLAMATLYLLPILNGTSAYEGGVQIYMGICAVGGAASLMFIGFDWIRGGQHFDLSTYESGPIFSR